MQSNNTFNITRFGMLCRQNLAHHSRLVLTSLVAFCGGLFILLLIIQFADGFRPVGEEMFFGVFLTVFTITGVICAGTAFPNLRSREKTQSYLMVPASVLEKFAMELTARLLLFVLVVPLVYWAVYNIEGYIVSIFYSNFSFTGATFTQAPGLFTGATDTATERLRIFAITGGLLVFVTPFTGASMFTKSPLIKTLFGVAVIFFFNLFLIYFFLEVLNFNQFTPTSPILFVRHMEDGILAFIIGSIIFNAGFTTAAYFKLKEREG